MGIVSTLFPRHFRTFRVFSIYPSMSWIETGLILSYFVSNFFFYLLHLFRFVGLGLGIELLLIGILFQVEFVRENRCNEENF